MTLNPKHVNNIFILKCYFFLNLGINHQRIVLYFKYFIYDQKLFLTFKEKKNEMHSRPFKYRSNVIHLVGNVLQTKKIIVK